MKSSAKISILAFSLFSLIMLSFSVIESYATPSLEKTLLSEDTVRIQTNTKTPVLDIQLLENTDNCLTDCHAILKVHPYQDIMIPSSADTEFRWDFVKDKPWMKGLTSYHFEVLTNVSYDVSIPIYENVSYESVCDYNPDNTTYKCTKWRMEQTGSRTETRYRDEFKPFSFWSQTLLSDKDYTIKLSGRKPVVFGQNNIDWIPTIKGIQLNEWDWWNDSVTYRQPIHINASGISDDVEGYPRFVNGTYGIDTASLISASKLDSNGYCLWFVNNGSDDTEELYWHFYNKTSATYGINTGRTLIIANGTTISGNTAWYMYYDDDCGASTHTLYMNADNVYDTNFKGVYYWYEEQGTTLHDYSGNNNDGTFSGNAAYDTHGKAGYGGYFDGTNDHIDLGDDADFESDDFTIEAWVDPRGSMQLDNGIVLGKGKANNYEYGFFIDSDGDGRVTAWNDVNNCEGQAWLDAPGPGGTNLFPPDNAHHYVAAVLDNGNTDLFIYYPNGTQAGSDTSPTGTRCPNKAAKAKIGERDDGIRDYDGYIDMVWYSDTVRSSDWLKLGHQINESYMDSSWEIAGCPSAGTNINVDTTYSPLFCNFNSTALVISADEITLDCNGMTLNFTGTVDGRGIENMYYNNITIKNCIIQNFGDGILTAEGSNSEFINIQIKNSNDYGIWFDNTINTTLVNSSVTNSNTADFYLRNQTSVSILNTSWSSVEFEDYVSELYNQWYTRVNVSNETTQIENANVSVYDKNNNLEWTDTTDSQGLTGWNMVTEFRINYTGQYNHTPHTFKANHSDLGTDETTLSITTKTLVNLVIGLWNITFNVTGFESGTGVDNVNITCNYTSFDQGGDTTNPYGPFAFPQDTWSCVFDDDGDYYHTKSIIFTAENDTTIDVVLGDRGGLTPQEHIWLEKLYNCLYLGIEEDCETTNQINSISQTTQDTNEKVTTIEQYVVVINQTVQQINETTINLWEAIKPTDKSVVLSEINISNVVNDTNNITINYSVYIPEKEGYEEGDFLPIRISYWFLDENNESCYNQGNESLAGFELIEPYCVPLTVYTLGQMNSTINFTVQLRPSVPEGTYNIIRSIEIDPNQVWINYGQEVIGQVEVQESNEEILVGVTQAIRAAANDPITGLTINNPINLVNISIIVSIFVLTAVGLFSFRKRFYY